ncbi:LysE/ArgO family amino acid transporter [Moraxella sp. ZJ142]|uniref:LysE/ArgO family amino acid transporter n=1 Tax=Moraxella marmotae TaxID=3344520 RepID=UPI0035D4A520
MFSPAFIQGLLVSGGLIVAIGAQNAYVLKQGLLKNHIFWVALTCFLCDFVLISFGVLGFGSLISQSPMATIVLAIVGALFLFVYGLRALRSAISGSSGLAIDSSQQQATIAATIGTTLALTLLNPHVYLDTVVIIGGVAGTLTPEQKLAFLAGSLTASALWFFGLGYGARLLIPLFNKPVTWRVLDGIIALVMWAIALSLAMYAYQLYLS